LERGRPCHRHKATEDADFHHKKKGKNFQKNVTKRSMNAMGQESEAENDSQSIDPSFWVDEYGDILFRFAFIRLRDRQLAEDAVQETFLAALKARTNFQARSSERTWLIGILKHKVLDYFRKAGKEISIDQIATSTHDAENFNASGEWLEDRAPLAWNGDPAHVLQDHEFRRILNSCLEELPPRLSQIFVLREVQELSNSEICKLLGITENNLWVMLHRARMQLRRSLEAKYFRKK
jgi:RNA polymerase sigma-70 factor, ECF subfamily